MVEVPWSSPGMSSAYAALHTPAQQPGDCTVESQLFSTPHRIRRAGRSPPVTTADRPPTVPGPSASRRIVPALAAVAVLVAVGCITLGPPDAVADARRAVMAGVELLAAPWPGAVHRGQVEAVANALLFVPVGALAALTLRRRGPVLPVLLGAGSSVLVELAQIAIPGRVPDPVDVVANTVGTALGVALSTVLPTLSRQAADRRRGVRCPRSGTLAALVAAPLVIAAVSGCGGLTAQDGRLRDGEVLSPSAHVTGDAVDIGPTEAMYWLSQHGSRYGLCQTYANEVWHFELTVERGGECPAPVAAPTAG